MTNHESSAARIEASAWNSALVLMRAELAAAIEEIDRASAASLRAPDDPVALAALRSALASAKRRFGREPA
jgi:hypothetical protein